MIQITLVAIEPLSPKNVNSFYNFDATALLSMREEMKMCELFIEIRSTNMKENELKIKNQCLVDKREEGSECCEAAGVFYLRTRFFVRTCILYLQNLTN